LELTIFNENQYLYDHENISCHILFISKVNITQLPLAFCAFEKEKMINNDEGVPLLLFSEKSRPAFV
jgi:hypothetical protein